jgi:hypothetical protein
MAGNIQAESFSELQGPLLTAYINTNPGNSANRGLVAPYVTWLRSESKSLAPSVLPAEQKIFQEQVNKVEDFLRTRKPKEKSLVILCSPREWKVVPLQLEVENEIHWGRPALARLLSLQAMHTPCCIAVVDRAGARFFQYFLGEWTELREMKFELNVKSWKRKDIGHLAHPGIKTTRGSQRDTFEHRVDAQYARISRKVAEQVFELCYKNRLKAAFLVGLPRLIEPIENQLPASLRERTVLVKEDLGRLPLSRLRKQLESAISSWDSQHQEPGWVRMEKRAGTKAQGTMA